MTEAGNQKVEGVVITNNLLAFNQMQSEDHELPLLD